MKDVYIGTEGNKIIEEAVSNVIYTDTGAPQGSALLPILFKAYIHRCQIYSNKKI